MHTNKVNGIVDTISTAVSKNYVSPQVIWKFNNAEKKRKENGDVELNWEFESVRVLVLDEGSLVPVGLLHSVLSKLISHAELQKFILLGERLRNLWNHLQAFYVYMRLRFGDLALVLALGSEPEYNEGVQSSNQRSS